MSILTPEQATTLQLVFDVHRVFLEQGDIHYLLENHERLVLVCPHCYANAVASAKLMMEARILVPGGHGYDIVLNTIESVQRNATLFERFKGTPCNGLEKVIDGRRQPQES